MTDYTRASCRGLDPRDWDDYGTPLAHAVCAACPIRSECLADALLEQTLGQMRAGHVFPDIAGTIRPQRPRAAVCGTDPGYHRHKREGTPRCKPCRRAHADAEKARRNRRGVAA